MRDGAEFKLMRDDLHLCHLLQLPLKELLLRGREKNTREAGQKGWNSTFRSSASWSSSHTVYEGHNAKSSWIDVTFNSEVNISGLDVPLWTVECHADWRGQYTCSYSPEEEIWGLVASPWASVNLVMNFELPGHWTRFSFQKLLMHYLESLKILFEDIQSRATVFTFNHMYLSSCLLPNS